MKNVTQSYVGVDVSKKKLDIHIYPNNETFCVDNTKKGIEKISKRLKIINVAKVMLEASGGYERLAVTTLSRNYNTYLVNPKRVRDFRKASGKKAKTDPVDASLIAKFAANDCSENIMPLNEKDVLLSDLFKRKQELKKMLSAEKNRLEKKSNKAIEREIDVHIRFLKRRIKKIDTEIKNIIKSVESYKRKKEIIESMPGVGNETAQGIISDLPEAGEIDGKSLASLVGLAPQTNESGQFVGHAKIGKGRSEPRKLLYMAALSAIKHNPVLKSFYNRLREKGKPFKVAIVAIMRKMIVILNTMLRKNEMWRLEPDMSK